MINNWLHYQEAEKKYVFKLIHVTENNEPSQELINYLQKEIITSYRQLEYYKIHFNEEPEEKLKEYIEQYVIPSDKNQIAKNVRQGDWGEILAALIVMYFQDLEVPIHKLRWKFNKDRSVFSTDMVAHNKGDIIEQIYYYEIKTRQNPKNKEHGEYITVIAHNSLLKDEQAPTEAIADFLSRYYFNTDDYDNSKKYNEIVKNPHNYNRNFELFFIIEKDKYIEDILVDLHNLPPKLEPLKITVVFIDNLKVLIQNTWKNLTDEAVKLIRDN